MAKSTKTAQGRILSPENCPVPLSAAMMAENRRRERRGERPMTRFANCDIRSAEFALSQQPANAGTQFSGTMRRGIHKDADLVSRGAVPMSFWKHSLARASAAFKRPDSPPPMFPSPIPRGGLSLLPWWPKGSGEGGVRSNPTPRGYTGHHRYVIETNQNGVWVYNGADDQLRRAQTKARSLRQNGERVRLLRRWTEDTGRPDEHVSF